MMSSHCTEVTLLTVYKHARFQINTSSNQSFGVCVALWQALTVHEFPLVVVGEVWSQTTHSADRLYVYTYIHIYLFFYVHAVFKAT